ncbi:MAG: hypothetical protein R2991_02940 [Thermoanaerobaculia bacterium]
MAKRWKKTDVTYLKRYAKKKRVAELAERFKTDISTVQAKLAEIGVSALDSVIPTALEQSPVVEQLQRGLKLLHESKWKQAAEIFEAVAEKAQQTELIATARRYLEVCREKTARRRKTDNDTDPYLLAVVERNRGNLEEAHAICAAGGRRSKDPRFAYLAAALFAQQEEYDESARFLELAFELDPATRVHAQLDSVFEPMRAEPGHARLF